MPPRKYYDKPCQVCGTLFRPRSEKSKFCSYKCSTGGKRSGPKRVKTAPRPCEYCNTVYTPNHGKQRFCSQQCSGKAMMPRMTAEERACNVEGCDRPKVRSDPGYCSKHDYRYRFYGDPLAETTRQKRDDSGIDLDVDWEEIENTTYWQKDPTHCPSGHEYTDENTNYRNARDGTKRRICKACQSEAAKRRARGEKPDRTATCQTCGLVWEASKFGTLPRFCSSCALKRQRAKSRLALAKKRGQKPKGPTYTCTACGIVSPTPENSGPPPQLCDVCANQNILDQKRRMWRKKNLDRYSLTPERYAALVESQNNQCAICKTNDPGGSIARWHVDHDHTCCGPGVSCGKCVRGLLCSRCNTALGLFDDSMDRLEVAIDYFRNPPAKNVD